MFGSVGDVSRGCGVQYLTTLSPDLDTLSLLVDVAMNCDIVSKATRKRRIKPRKES